MFEWGKAPRVIPPNLHRLDSVHQSSNVGSGYLQLGPCKPSMYALMVHISARKVFPDG